MRSATAPPFTINLTKEKMKTYKVTKRYPNYQSRNTVDAVNLTYEEAINWLDATEKNWIKNGGVVEERTEESLFVTEGNGEGRIVFSVEVE